MNKPWTAVGISDPQRILAFLETDRLYAAYAIGDLEPELFAQCAWAGAERDGRLQALGLQFRGLEPAALFLMGDPDGVRAILEGGPLHPARAYITCRREHLPPIRFSYAWESVPYAMWRMTLARRKARPADDRCVRLSADHAGRLRELFEYGGGTSFSEAQIQRGIFFGIFEGGRLIAAAGTHLVSPAHGVAAVGNILTHPDHRRRGCAAAATGAVLDELERIGIRDIVLNVRQDNSAAVRLYEKLGFERHCAFVEGSAAGRRPVPAEDDGG